MAIQMQEFRAFAELTSREDKAWSEIRETLGPLIWAWYDAHKEQKVTTLFKIYPITIGSFGIAEAVLTNLIGPRT